MNKKFALGLRSLQSKTYEIDSEMEGGKRDVEKPATMQCWPAGMTVYSANLVMPLDVFVGITARRAKGDISRKGRVSCSVGTCKELLPSATYSISGSTEVFV